MRLRAAFQSLIVILLVALALRVGYAWRYRAAHSEQALRAIPFLFEPGNIAYSLASGKGFSSPLRVESGPTAWMTPIYPLILGGVFRVFGPYTFPAWVAAVAFNILCGVLTVAPIYRTGGAVAGWIWAVFPNALIIPVESMWDASLAALLAALLVSATLRVVGSRRGRDWVGYGALWGAALMTNAVFVAVLPVFFGWLLWRFRGKLPLVSLGVAAAVCVPWTVRNYEQFGRFVPLRSVMGVSLWMGTIDPAGGRWPASYHPLADGGERAKYVEMGEIAYMEEKRRVALAFMREHPGTEARLCVERFVAFWSGGSFNPLREWVRVNSLWFRWVLVFNLCLAVAGLGGLVVLVWVRDPRTIVMAAMPVVIPFAYYLTLASARYRLVVDPAMAVLAAAGLERFVRRQPG